MTIEADLSNLAVDLECSIEPPLFVVWLSRRNHTFGVARKADVRW